MEKLNKEEKDLIDDIGRAVAELAETVGEAVSYHG